MTTTETTMVPDPDVSPSLLSDAEIDDIIREVAGKPAERPKGDRDGRASILYLVAFLLGMTVMEGLRLLAPPVQEVRGPIEHRCEGFANPNPGAEPSVRGGQD
ncbi:MAG: hypothetical protein HKN29_03140 [Rhodothermales bacterium]|nr:hypothetical protein [Rhodothermales bacterium]